MATETPEKQQWHEHLVQLLAQSGVGPKPEYLAQKTVEFLEQSSGDGEPPPLYRVSKSLVQKWLAPRGTVPRSAEAANAFADALLVAGHFPELGWAQKRARGLVESLGFQRRPCLHPEPRLRMAFEEVMAGAGEWPVLSTGELLAVAGCALSQRVVHQASPDMQVVVMGVLWDADWQRREDAAQEMCSQATYEFLCGQLDVAEAVWIVLIYDREEQVDSDEGSQERRALKARILRGSEDEKWQRFQLYGCENRLPASLTSGYWIHLLSGDEPYKVWRMIRHPHLRRLLGAVPASALHASGLSTFLSLLGPRDAESVVSALGIGRSVSREWRFDSHT